MWLIVWILALVCVQLINPVLSADSICLLKPYITSATLNSELVSPGRYKIAIDIDLDYRKQFNIENIYINFNFDSKTLRTEFDQLDITYKGEIAIVRTSRDRKGTHYFTDVKADYYRRVSRMLKQHPITNALFFGHYCSASSIKDAFLFEPFDSEGGNYNFVNYKDSVRCVSVKNSNFMIDFKDWGVTGASYHNNVMVEFFPNFVTFKVYTGALYGKIIDWKLNERGFLVETIDYQDLFSNVCENATKSLLLTGTTDEDLLGSGSFQAFTKYDGMFIGFKPSLETVVLERGHPVKYQELYNWTKTADGYKMSIQKADSLPWIHRPQFNTLDAISISDEPTPTAHAFYFNHDYTTGCRYYYLRNFQPGLGPSPDPLPVCQPNSPDDITHWSSCRKIVAIHGLTYGLFEYDGDLLKDQVQFQLFDEHLFDHPITAVHAEKDEFWFFTKPFTVQVMTASSKDCSKLNLVKKHTIHYRQLFDPEIKQVMLEGRYHDGLEWTPSWDYVPSMQIEEPQLWTYVAGGLALTALFLVLLLIYILRRSERNRGASVYSLSRNSSMHHNSSPLTDKDNGTAMGSAMPLFSQHETLHRSSSSISAKRKSSSPANRRKYLEAPPIKHKKSKSAQRPLS